MGADANDIHIIHLVEMYNTILYIFIIDHMTFEIFNLIQCENNVILSSIFSFSSGDLFDVI